MSSKSSKKQTSGGVLKSLSKFTGKNLCQNLFLGKVMGLLKRDSNTGVGEIWEI